MDFFCSKRKRAWWWKPVPGKRDSQTERQYVNGQGNEVQLPHIACQLLKQAYKTATQRKGYCHQCSAKQEHEKEISRSPSERSFLQHSAVAIGEYHVEQKIESYRPEEQKVCHQSPHLKNVTNNSRLQGRQLMLRRSNHFNGNATYLVVLEYQVRIKIQLVRSDDVQLLKKCKEIHCYGVTFFCVGWPVLTGIQLGREANFMDIFNTH